MKKVILLVSFLLCGTALFADETFDSEIYKKEIQQVVGSGTLSVASNVYSILVYSKKAYMRIEIPKQAFDLLRTKDIVRITVNRGLFSNEIKSISLVRQASSPALAPLAEEQDREQNGEQK